MLKNVLFAFCASLLFLSGVAQSPEEGFNCRANEGPALLQKIASDPLYLQNALNADEQLHAFTQELGGGAPRNTYTIPVVFHIIHNHGVENISDAQIEDAIRILNEDLNNLNPATPNVRPEFIDIVANVGIQFELARRDPEGNCTNGITRTASQLTYTGDFEMTQLIQWPRERYLNVWLGASANGAAGYTYYPMWLNNWPEADGIVVLHSYVGSIGTSEPYRSHVLTHEVGHWLNLKHCWGNSNEPGSIANCSMDDDVADTPLTKGWTGCSLSGASCGSELDNVENYMEYSYCYKMFTIGQAERMLAALNSPIAQRNELWQSSNLENAGLNDAPVVCEARFMHSNTHICPGSTVQFTDMSFHSITQRTWSFPGGTPSTSNEVSPIVTYDVPGIYLVTLEVSDGTETMVHTKDDLVRVFGDPGVSVPYFQGFENMDALPAEEWWTKDHSSENTFVVTDIASFSGQRSVVFVNGPSEKGMLAELRSPALDLENAPGLSVSFRYAFARRTPDDQDRLRVHFSTNCGVHWSIRKQLRASTTLITADMTNAFFIPQGPDDWELAVIDIPAEAFHVSSLLMRFEFLSDGGNNLYIDDINIHGSPVGIADLMPGHHGNMLLVPNPTTDRMELLLYLQERTPTRIVLRDVIGRELDLIVGRTLDAGPNRIEISLAGMATGIYLIEVQQGGHRSTLRAVKE